MPNAEEMETFVPQKQLHYLCIIIITHLKNCLPLHYRYTRGGMRVGTAVGRLEVCRVLLQKCCNKRPARAMVSDVLVHYFFNNQSLTL